jgi:hypothetical protein
MNEQAKILDYAKTMGVPANRAKKVATTAVGDVYALAYVGKDGLPVPMGLPCFVIKHGEKFKLVGGPDGLKLLESLDRKK